MTAPWESLWGSSFSEGKKKYERWRKECYNNRGGLTGHSQAGGMSGGKESTRGIYAMISVRSIGNEFLTYFSLPSRDGHGRNSHGGK